MRTNCNKHDLSGEIGRIYNVKENAIIDTTVIL